MTENCGEAILMRVVRAKRKVPDVNSERQVGARSCKGMLRSVKLIIYFKIGRF